MRTFEQFEVEAERFRTMEKDKYEKFPQARLGYNKANEKTREDLNMPIEEYTQKRIDFHVSELRRAVATGNMKAVGRLLNYFRLNEEERKDFLSNPAEGLEDVVNYIDNLSMKKTKK